MRHRMPHFAHPWSSIIFKNIIATILMGLVAIPSITSIDKTEDKKRQKEVVERVNSVAHRTWEAKFNPSAYGPLSEAEMNKSFALPEKHYEHLVAFVNDHSERGKKWREKNRIKFQKEGIKLPTYFDASKHFIACEDTISSVPNQAGCGSSWAAAATSVMTDKYCIKSNGTDKRYVSMEDLVSCCPWCGNCMGGGSSLGFHYWATDGIVSGGPHGSKGGCKSFHSEPNCGSPCHLEEIFARGNPTCVQRCTANKTIDYAEDKKKGKTVYTVVEDYVGNKTQINALKRELYLNGPVATFFRIYEDFLHYKSGVYQYITGSKISGHFMKIIGWGQEQMANGKNVDYWLVVNSWGPFWGASQGDRTPIYWTLVSGQVKIGVKTIMNYSNPEGPKEELVTSMVTGQA